MTGTEDDVASFVAARWQGLVRFGFMLTGDRAAGEDLVQEALLRCLPSWGRLDPRGVEAYVRKVMARLVWKARRHPLRMSWSSDQAEPTTGIADASSEQSDLRRALKGPAGPTAGRPGAAVLAGPERGRDRGAARMPAGHGEEPRKPRLRPGLRHELGWSDDAAMTNDTATVRGDAR